jgi:hypothetical protein
MSEEHYVEVVETATGKVEKRMGPMPESKAERVERGLLINMDTEFFHVRTGTDAALKAEAYDAKADAETLSPTAAAPGWEAELEDGQGLAARRAVRRDGLRARLLRDAGAHGRGPA